MLIKICPKLPMRNVEASKAYYINQLAFSLIADYGNYLILEKDKVEIHFFEYKDLDPAANYGQVYIRVKNIKDLYEQLINAKVTIHSNGALIKKPWGQLEFSLLDVDNNLLTFGEED